MLAAVAGLACTVASSRAAITLGFTSSHGTTSSSVVNFDGSGGFSFVTAVGGTDGGSDITLNSSTGAGDSYGDTGLIGGNFTIGTITTVGSTSTASVTGGGTISIFDGTKTLTGNLTWDQITQSGTGNGLNIAGLINVTSISYNGAQADLSDLAAGSLGSESISFTFNPAKTLAYLKLNNVSDGYSGQISSAVPEPTTVLAGALLLLPLGASTVKILRHRRATA